jgi:hypothetical protein
MLPDQSATEQRRRRLLPKKCELASAYCRSENVVIHPVVIAELKLSDVQWEIFRADFVERSDDTALHNRPEPFNRVGVDRADNVLAFAVVYDLVRVAKAQSMIRIKVIGAEKADAARNSFPDESLDGFLFQISDDASDDVSFALHSADDCDFPFGSATSSALPFIQMAVPIGASDIGFVDLDDAPEFRLRLDQCSADFVGHGERGFVRTEAHVPLNLERANSLLAGEHQVNDAEPFAEGLIRVLENRSGDMGEAITGARVAFVALPLVDHRGDGENLVIATARACNAVRPAPSDEVLPASFLIGKHRLKLTDSHLVDCFWTPSHSGSPCRFREYDPKSRTSQVADNRLTI